jgi:hypothetical protein
MSRTNLREACSRGADDQSHMVQNSPTIKTHKSKGIIKILVKMSDFLAADSHDHESEEDAERLHWKNVMRTILFYEDFISLEFEVSWLPSLSLYASHYD